MITHWTRRSFILYHCSVDMLLPCAAPLILPSFGTRAAEGFLATLLCLWADFQQQCVSQTPPAPHLKQPGQIFLFAFGVILHSVVGVADCSPACAAIPLLLGFLLPFCLFERGLELPHCATRQGSGRLWSECIPGLAPKLPSKISGPLGGLPPPQKKLKYARGIMARTLRQFGWYMGFS